ncbi:hypothetical protein [Polymorphum gilvum]|nr:hypothetical protein [Polymorphum gilvum]
MYVALGFLSASLAGLAIASAVWKRAVRLTREAVLATNPSSYAEVRAAQDSARAEHALTVRRLERELESLKEASVAMRLDLGRALRAEKALVAERDALAQQQRELNATREAQTAELDRLRKEAAQARHQLEAASRAEAAAAKADGGHPSGHEWREAADTMALATITGLEAQIATLKRRLEDSERGAEILAEQVAPDADADGLRHLVARLESQLVDMEADYIAAQAEVARLTLHLDMADAAPDERISRLDGQLKQAAAEQARLAARVQDRERVLSRSRTEIARLRREMARGEGIAALRQDLKDLARKIAGPSGADAAEAPARDMPEAGNPARTAKSETKTTAPAKRRAPTAEGEARSAAELAGRIVKASKAAAAAGPAASANPSAPDPDKKKVVA